MEKHDLHSEFPEFDSKIHDLKTSNNHFKKLFDDYHDVNKKIHSVESSNIFTDSELNDLRSKRLHLKDELYQMLSN